MFIKIPRSIIYSCIICALPFGQKVDSSETTSSFITYEFSGGRFGDNLLAYLHAKWISYLSKTPLLYKPFPYSSLLQLDDSELRESALDLSRHQSINLSTHPKIQSSLQLYVCPYFPESNWERHKTKDGYGKKWFYFDVDWNNSEFRKMAKNLISPKEKYQLTIPPAGTIGVAIHVRNGGGYDPTDAGLHVPTKFPPIDFYTDALLKVISLFRDMKIYCFVFTDALNPQSVVDQIKTSVPAETPIVFDCRLEDNFHDKNVLEDFFSLFHFDVLIHPESNFSLIPTLLQDYAIVCTPLWGYCVGKTATIDQVSFKINELLYKKAREKCLIN